jgi:hypothetical protein
MDPWESDPAVWPDPDTLVGGSGPESTLCDDPPVTLPRARHAGFTADLSESA